MAIVTLTTALPHAAIEHAGGKYLNLLFKALGPEAVTVVAPPLPSVMRAMGLPGHPPNTIVTDSVSPRLMRLEAHARRIDFGQPSWSLRQGIVREGQLRSALESADVIDLQWQDCVRLAPLVRRIAPRARLVGTFHDVQSQKFERLARSSTGKRKAKWVASHRIALSVEARAMQTLDEVVVFSQKDAELLPSGAPVSVVDPPLAPEVAPKHRPGAEMRVLFVSFLSRPENQQGAHWLLSEVWPEIHRRFPSAKLRLVGAGAPPGLLTAAAAVPNVEVPGYVDDLDAEMGQAWLAVSPIHEGAGVKFKTIEALLAGVPVVTTSVGAEGIGPSSLFWGVADDSAAFTEAALTALTDPSSAQARADEAQSRTTQQYGLDRFQTTVRRVYGVTGSSVTGGPHPPET